MRQGDFWVFLERAASFAFRATRGSRLGGRRGERQRGLGGRFARAKRNRRAAEGRTLGERARIGVTMRAGSSAELALASRRRASYCRRHCERSPDERCAFALRSNPAVETSQIGARSISRDGSTASSAGLCSSKLHFLQPARSLGCFASLAMTMPPRRRNSGSAPLAKTRAPSLRAEPGRTLRVRLEKQPSGRDLSERSAIDHPRSRDGMAR